MMKNLLAVALLATAGSVMAADPEAFTPGEDALGAENAAVSQSSTYTYQTLSVSDRKDRKFVKNLFDFTLSANVVAGAGEDADSRFMIVAAGNTQGRNLFVGHSNGGSVAACGDQLTSAEVKAKDLPYEKFKSRVDFDAENGCTP